MRVLSDRFNLLDEVVHITIASLINEVYHQVKQELIDNYGSDIVEEAYDITIKQYGSVVARFCK